MAKISLLHTIMLLVATVVSSTIFAIISWDIHTYIKVLMTIASILSLILLYFIYPKFDILEKFKINTIFAISIGMNGIIFALIVYAQIKGMTISIFFKLASIFILSWLIGFVTPGASGGLGVREASFIAIAKFIHLDLPFEIILFSVFLIRLINIIGDIFNYLLSFLVPKKYGLA